VSGYKGHEAGNYIAGLSSVNPRSYACVFQDEESVPMAIVISELNSIKPLVEKLRAANRRILELESKASRSDHGIAKGMAKVQRENAALQRKLEALNSTKEQS